MEFKDFVTSVGVEGNASGTVQFEVWVDGKQKAVSPVLQSSSRSHLRVDVEGAKSVLLRVTNGGDGCASDHAAWGGARFFRGPLAK